MVMLMITMLRDNHDGDDNDDDNDDDDDDFLLFHLSFSSSTHLLVNIHSRLVRRRGDLRNETTRQDIRAVR